MKTAVSVPNDVFARADALAKATGRSRSEVYSAALAEYVARHADDEVTATLERVVDQLGIASGPDEFVGSAASRVLGEIEW
jgi:predicted transcriptional regulator